jgi:hypothetical protein
VGQGKEEKNLYPLYLEMITCGMWGKILKI